MAKCLANRLKKSWTQLSLLRSLFSFRRDSFQTTLCWINFECTHVINSRRKMKNGYAALKIDMGKAYDIVELPYLRMIMCKMGFMEA